MRTGYFIIITALLLFAGCGSISSLQQREESLNTLLQNHKELKKEVFTASAFNLFGVSKLDSSCRNKSINLFIEGDGLAWISRTRLSSNPTPINPLAFKLMLEDKASCKLYLARPCQYIDSQQCQKKYWSSARFSPEVVQSYLEIMDSLKKSHDIEAFNLIGYSGGGAVATLLSSKRTDIKQLITIAGNLDINAWVKYHQITPLYDSLNPADYADSSLQNIPQMHFIGAKDNVMPFEIFQAYQQRFHNSTLIQYRVCDECTHTQNWLENASKVLQTLY